LVHIEQLTKFLIAEPKNLYGHCKIRSLDAYNVTCFVCVTKAYFNIMLQFFAVSHLSSVLFSN